MILAHTHYRSYLKAELASRTEANGSYSLRAFASKLGLSSSFLSEVIRGKKALSTNAALKIAKRLELNDLESRYFCLMVQLEAEKDPAQRGLFEEKLRAMNPSRRTVDLSTDVFKAISDWYHFAILELTYLTGFELTASAAARRLGIAQPLADAAIDRLLRLDLLERDPLGVLRKTHDSILAQSHVPNAALKNFHAQCLAKAIAALKTQAPGERISSTDVVPIHPRYLPQVKKFADQFTSELIKLSERSKPKQDVYCLSVHFFNLTPNPTKGT